MKNPTLAAAAVTPTGMIPTSSKIAMKVAVVVTELHYLTNPLRLQLLPLCRKCSTIRARRRATRNRNPSLRNSRRNRTGPSCTLLPHRRNSSSNKLHRKSLKSVILRRKNRRSNNTNRSQNRHNNRSVMSQNRFGKRLQSRSNLRMRHRRQLQPLPIPLLRKNPVRRQRTKLNLLRIRKVSSYSQKKQ